MTAAVRSMTGFGRGEAHLEDVHVSVELRAVNHRFADLQFKAPRAYGALQPRIEARVREDIERGRIEILVRREVASADARVVVIDEGLATSYAKAASQLADRLGRSGEQLPLRDLLGLPGVAQVRDAEVDPDGDLPIVLEAIGAALTALIGMRVAEGARLAADVRSRLAEIERLVGEVEQLASEAPALIRDRIVRRVQGLLGDVKVDADRLLQEASVLADKVAIDEETTRLRSHLAQAEELLNTPGAVGRRLDFLIQEFQREVNTIGSKATGTQIAPRVVAMKSEVEKIREQVANIE
jgi:uncharacterized protein (TIGR00255 family)